MRVEKAPLDGVLLFFPTPHHDDRGLFTRVFDVAVAKEHGLDPDAFIQDSQSRSRKGTIRGMHGRSGRGEAKLVRCARGAILDILVDARPDSPTFGEVTSVRLDDDDFATLYVPPGLLHGFQALTDQADVCYRIDREHDPSEDLAVRFDDPELKIEWPLALSAISARDRDAGSWEQLRARL
ncbi:dTDP-4-dehydrorhamnose 3,5-epimerase family protein [Spongiactinospora sp. TRM90649]|uniref:dTDP-4-dehydrorhamnose 3,5-epimerase family protein n=1 Tax=Spongiactinospora sp. TRM90649 TaxID=3031114 RepID=UPI0023F8E6BF|nr:dTDP-4-dehydrorhamnose 3,5-epimerase family protein [Spongiactinospora sp. TRM90649]MDF5755018.1 dTDP-4-dehydrorhamnose 3,5-epimerase family protein [Spongiactinospora sp. TRM90649]